MRYNQVLKAMASNKKIYEFFASEVKIGANGREYRPADSSLRLDEALELQRLVAESRACHTMEIGLALGASAVAISEALEHHGDEARHLVLDPFQSEFGDVGLAELSRLELRERVEFLPLFSHEFLHDCIKQGRRFDLIFNDGAHAIGSKVTDAFLADQCLNPGGILAFHDAFMFSVTAAVKYLAQERGYQIIELVPDSRLKRCLRALKYGARYGWWYGTEVVPCTARSIVALRKPVKLPQPT